MDEIIFKLLSLSKKKHSSDDNFKQFQDYVESLSYEQIEDLLTGRICSFDVPQFLNSIFLGLSMKTASQKKRIKVFEHVLSLLQEKDIHSGIATGLVSWLIVELEKMSVTHLVRICDLCVNYVSKSESPQHTSWKSIIPKVLSLVVVKKDVDHYGSEMSGEKYKSEVITALTQAKWNKHILSSLADMFRYIPLSLEEHGRILGKLVRSLEELHGSELPPLGHNLLLLCKSQGLVTVLFAFNTYYQTHLYSKPTDEDIHADVKEVSDSESVMLYHVTETVRQHSDAGTQILKSAKLSAAAPHLWLEPFLLAVLLALSDIPPHGDQVVSVISGMVVRLAGEGEMLKEYAWLRKLEIETPSSEKVFTKLIKSEVCGQEGVLRGLVSLGMCLLGKERKVARIGRLIAVNLVSRHPYVARHLINTITDSIISQPALTQYTDCLCELCDTAPLVVVEYSPSLGRLMEELPALPISAAYRLASAIVSLFKVSHKIRDSLILALRKALFAHNVSARKVAVIGFLQLLKRMKMRGFTSLSQNSFQIYTCPSIFTQSCLQVHSQSGGSSASANNEGICMEILNVLKRCFVQQAEVKLCLYEGVSRALLENPELCLPASEIFLSRLRHFYEPDTTVLPPLRITEAFVISDGSITLQEPLAELVFVVQQTVVTVDQVLGDVLDNEEYIQNREKIYTIMDSLVERFAICSPKTLQLEDEEEDDEGVVEVGRKEETMKQALGILEALISYFLWKWQLSVTVDRAGSLLALYRTHSSLLDFAKEFKSQKKDKDKRTQGTQKKAGVGRKPTFVAPPTILDFETIHRLLSLLLSDSVEWCADDVLEDLQGRRPLHRYAMGSCASVLARARSRLALYKPRSTFNNLLLLAKLLFEKVMKDIPKLMEFDPGTAVLGVENYTEVFSLVAEFYPSQLSKFLSESCGVGESEGLNNQLERVIKSYLKSLGKILDMDEEEEDQNHKRLMSALIAGVNAICLHLPVTGTCILKVVGWLSEVVEKRVISSVPDAKCLLSLLITLSHRTKTDASLYDNLALHLATIYSTINDVEVEKADSEYAMVNPSTKGIVVPLICASLNNRLSSVDWLVQRTKAELALLSTTSNPSDYKGKVKEKEREVIVQAGFVSSTAQILASIRAPSSGELLSKTLHRLYSSLTSLTKYFHTRSTQANPAYQEARFGKLVKLAGTHLSSQLADFLLFIESLESVVDENEKKISSKVLREAKKQTDYIPKLVTELENFTKFVTQLSNKCKDPSLAGNLKLTTTRDFRLNTRKLEELIKEQQESTQVEEETTVGEGEETSQGEGKKVGRRGRKRKAEGAGEKKQTRKRTAS